MQFEQQEMRYGPDFNYQASKRAGYLNPTLICEDRHKFRVGKDNPELLGLEGDEWEKKFKEMKMAYESKYAFYIATALLKYQDRESVVAPYHFG